MEVDQLKLTTKYEDYLHSRLAAGPTYAAEYLNACLEDADPRTFLIGLRAVARAYGVSLTAAEIAIDREGFCRVLSEQGNPSLQNLVTLLDSLGFALRIAPKAA